MVRLGRVLLVGVGVAAALAGLARHGVGRVEAEERTALYAWQQDEPRGSITTLKVTSRETVVDVTVTDKDGKPVHGLTKADFTVKEDGKVQPIRGFEEFGKAAPAAAKVLPKLPPNVYTNLQPPPASGATNILLLDFANSASPLSLSVDGAGDTLARSLAAQKLAKQDAMKYVATMPPGTRVIVLGLSNSLRTLQGATSDPELLAAAISTMEYNMAGGAGVYEQWCSQTETRARVTMEALQQIAADASAIKGKKNLLWFSVGLPWLTDPSARAKCLPDYFNDMLKSYGLLTAAQIAVYPIDVRGVPTMPDAFVTSMGRLWANVYLLAGTALTKAQEDFMQTTADEQLAMESIAEATGGAAYYNSNDLASLIAKAVDKGANYYTLTYVPPGTKYDYAHHSINVKVDQPGLHLVYRESYDAVDPATIKPPPGLTLATTLPTSGPVDMRLAMGRAMPTSQQILFDVGVESSTEVVKTTDPQGSILGTLDPVVKVKLKDKPLIRYNFNYAIPARQIAFSAGPNGTHNGSLELDIAVYDADAKLVTGLSQTVKMPLSDDKYRQFIQGPFRISQQIDLPAGQFFVRIGILDRTSNKVGTLELPLTVAKGSGAVTAGR
jgi:VWFA-related protein